MFPSNQNPNQKQQAPASATPLLSYNYGYAYHQQQAFTQPVIPQDQQMAIQQNLEAWKLYQAQYTQWQALYGEAYQREMAAQTATVAIPVQPPLPFGNPVPPPPPSEPPNDPKPPEPPAEGETHKAQQGMGVGYGREPNNQRNFGDQRISTHIGRGNSGNIPPLMGDSDLGGQKFGSWNNRVNQNNTSFQAESGGQNTKDRDRDNNWGRPGRGGRGNQGGGGRGNNNVDNDNNNSRGNNRGGNNRSNNNNDTNNTNTINNRWNNDRRNSNNRNINPWQSNSNDHVSNEDISNNSFTRNQGSSSGFSDYKDNGLQHVERPIPAIPEITGNVDEKTPEEVAFDLQFQKWESDFEDWKKANVNHPDRTAYREYEMKFEECRVKLVERREQMKRKKLEAVTCPTSTISATQEVSISQIGNESIIVEDEPLVSDQPKPESNKQWSYTNSFFNSAGGSSGGIPGLDMAEPTEESTKDRNNDDEVPVIDLVEDENPPQDVEPVQEVPGTTLPDMSEISKNVNNLLGNQQLLTLLSSLNKQPINAAQSAVAAVAPLLTVLSQVNAVDLQQQLALMQQPQLISTNLQSQSQTNFMGDQDQRQQRPQSNFDSDLRQMPSNHRGGNDGNRFNLNRAAFDFGDGDSNPDRGFGNRNQRFGGNNSANNNFYDDNSDSFGNNDRMGRNQYDNRGPNRNFGQFDRNFDDDGGGSMHSDQNFGGNSQRQRNVRVGDRFGKQNYDERSQGSRSGHNNNYYNDDFDEDEFDGSKYEEPAPESDFNSESGRGNFAGINHRGPGSFFGENRNNDVASNRRENSGDFEESESRIRPPTNEPRFDSVMEEFEYYRKQEEHKKTAGDLGGNSADGFNRKRDFSGESKSGDINSMRRDAFFRPTTVIDYHNRSSNPNANKSKFGGDLLVPTKVVDYGHKKPAGAKPLETDPNDTCALLLPMQTIDYGHAKKPLDPKAELLRKLNKRKKLKKHMKVPANKIVESNATYPCKWTLINDTRDFLKLQTKRGRRKNNAGKVIVKAMKVVAEVPEIENVVVEVVKQPDAKQPSPVQFLADKDALDNISSDSDDDDMDLGTDIEDDDRFYVKIDDLLLAPCRNQRPKKIIVILRGPPGSGKSHLAKLIKEKECSMGGSLPRILCFDDYFMVETDEIAKCPDTGRRIVKKTMVYEYEPEMENSYMQCLLKSFKKTVCDGLHSFIIVDCVNEKLDLYNEFYSFGMSNGFKVYTCELPRDLKICLKRNTHKRDPSEIERMIKNWPAIPETNILLDCRTLYKKEKPVATASEFSQMETVSSDEDLNDNADDDDETSKSGFFSSKWDADTSVKSLARLDGTSKPLRQATTIEDYLQMDGWEPIQKPSKPGQKRVRWADIEEKREQDKMRAIGFVVGQTNWDRMMDTSDGASALVKTKFIERVKKN